MSFQIFTNNLFTYTLVHVEIDHEKSLIRRTFDNTLPTVSGQVNPYNQSVENVKEAFDNEVFWLTHLQYEKFVPELVSVDLDSQVIIQRYYEPSLLISGKRPTVDEVVEMYKCFHKYKINKCNGSLSNLTYNGKQLVAFDFKHCQRRPGSEEKEFRSYNKWLVKIDPSLPEILTKMYYET